MSRQPLGNSVRVAGVLSPIAGDLPASKEKVG